MGPTDEDEEYARECFDLVDLMELPDVVFTGRVNVTEYLGGLDFTILTSISEGPANDSGGLRGEASGDNNRCWKLPGTVVRRGR